MTSIKKTTDRSFGILFSSIFIFFSGYAFYKDWNKLIPIMAFLAAFLTVTLAIFKPRLLAPLSKIWLTVGLCMGIIMQPIILGIIYYLLITPVALICRIQGRDELRLKKPTGGTYWLTRENKKYNIEYFKNQF